MKKFPLSLVLITLNADRILSQVLESCAFADEIIIVDSGSNDATEKIAKQYQAKFLFQQWLGFGKQKNFAINQAKNDWVLCLDADEIISEELQKNIVSYLENNIFNKTNFNDEVVGINLVRCNNFLGKFLKHGEGYPDICLRLFNKNFMCWSDDEVHEKVIFINNESNKKIITLHGDLLHYSVDSLEKYISKQNRYTTLSAQQLFNDCLQKNKLPSTLKIFAKFTIGPLVRFIKFYILKRGFLDGLPGFIHIVIGCLTAFMKYIKLYELILNKNNKDKNK